MPPSPAKKLILVIRFMDYIQEYREVERNSREKYRTRMERQYKIGSRTHPFLLLKQTDKCRPSQT